MVVAPFTSYQLERQVAISAVAHASRLARRLQNSLPTSSALTKLDASPVTVADFAVQALIVHKLRSAFPADKFIAEETTGPLISNPTLARSVAEAAGLSQKDVLTAIGICDHVGGDGARTWILDPIDGTRGFIAMRQYCIALGFIERGSVKLGVLGCPNLPLQTMIAKENDQTGCLFHAVKGDGSWMLPEKDLPSNHLSPSKDTSSPIGKRINVSDVADPIWSVFCESVETGHSSHELSARVASILGVSAPPVRMDSQAKYGCMARGDVSIFLRFPRHGYVENVWDSAPACIVIEEAGGRVTDGRGTPLNFSLGRKMDNEDGIVATNGLVHDAVVKAVQQAMREARGET